VKLLLREMVSQTVVVELEICTAAAAVMHISETSFTANHFTIRQHSDLSTDHVTQLNTATTNNNTAATQAVYHVNT